MKINKIIFFALAVSVYADFVMNTPPRSYTVGETITFTWSWDGQPDISSIDFELVFGASEALQISTVIAADKNPGDKSLDWTVPTGISINKEYAVRANAQLSDGPKMLYHSGRFGISGGLSGAVGGNGTVAVPTATPTKTQGSNSKGTSTASRKLPTLRYDPYSRAQALEVVSAMFVVVLVNVL